MIRLYLYRLYIFHFSTEGLFDKIEIIQIIEQVISFMSGKEKNKTKTKEYMSLRTRLLLGLVAIIVIPVVLALVLFSVVDNRWTEFYKKEYGLESFSYGGAFDNIMIYSIQTTDVFDSLLRAASDKPEDLSDERYLDSINNTLRQDNAFLVVRLGNSVIYNGSSE